MNVIDRYLQTVKRHLPRARQDDIVHELSANILAQVEDKEAELGRPLNETEQQAILDQLGHPQFVASRYHTGQGSLVFGRQLIGPLLFPTYVNVLWLNLGIAVLLWGVIATALVPSHQVAPDVLSNILAHFVEQFLIVTLVFTALDALLNNRFVPKLGWDEGWNPRNPLTLQPQAQGNRRVPRLESIAQIVVRVILLVWFRAVLDSSAAIFGAELKLGAIWERMYLLYALLSAVVIAQACINLVRPQWTQLRLVVRVATNILWLVMLIFLLTAGNWVISANAAGSNNQTVAEINRYFFYSLLATGALTPIFMAFDLRRWWRDSKREIAQLPTATS
jgi:hypothetical protein